MTRIIIGKSGTHNVSIDLQTLLSTRLLLTADSGGGKTWALKRLIEQAFGHVGILVIDPEGEFAPMRQKLDFYLVGKGGDTPADVRSAGRVARALYGARASAICDIYEMKPSERHAFVRDFLDALLEAPKDLRRPYLVIVDEAHIFCPEHGKGESEAADSMRSLCTRGRKRLLCPIFATQRLATLAKDASSMLLNRLVGPTFEEVNRKAAIQVLSIAPEHQQKFREDIQTLEPGNFYALGRAICKELTLVHIGPIQTPHGQEALKYELEPPPPTEKVRELLAKLGDLPKQAEEEARTIADFKKQIRELKVQMKAQPKIEMPQPIADPRAIHRELVKAEAFYRKQMAEAANSVNAGLLKKLKVARESLRDFDFRLAFKFEPYKVSGGEIQGKETSLSSPGVTEARVKSGAKYALSHHPRPEISRAENNGTLTGPQRRILQALAEFESIMVNEPTRSMIASWLGVKAGTGSFKNYLSELRVRGLIRDGHDERISLTDEGRAQSPDVRAAVTTEELLEKAASVFGSTTAKILRIVHAAHPDYISRESVANQLGISAETGSFKNYISELRVANMIEDGPDKTIKCADWMYL